MGRPRYRAAQLEAAIVGGNIYLGAYGYGYGATCLTFYDDEVTSFFSPHAVGKRCMLVVSVGESIGRPDLRPPLTTLSCVGSSGIPRGCRHPHPLPPVFLS